MSRGTRTCASPTRGFSRRSLLETVLGLALVAPWLRVAHTAESAGPEAATLRPQAGDWLVSSTAGAPADAVTPAGVPVGGPPVLAYPMDPATKTVRDGSRLNQILLVRLGVDDLSAETRTRAAAGVVGYSAICTHTGCDVWDWDARARTLKCPCHFSVFDVKDAARVLDGPAPRRLPALPLKVADGVLVVASAFVGRPGFQQGGA